MKKSCLLLLFLLVLACASLAVETVISHEEIRFDLVKTDPSPLKPGESFDIWFDVTNIQPYTIGNLYIRFVDMFPFTINDRNLSSINIGDLKPGEKKSIKYSVRINKDINEGSYPIALQYYSNKLGAIVSKDFNLNVKSSNVVVSTTNARLNPEKVRPGSQFELSIDLANTMNYAIADLSAELNLDGTPFVTLGGGSEKKIRQLAPSAIATLTYSLVANPESELKVYKVPLVINYYDQLGTKYSKNDTIGITVYAKPEYNIDLENSEVYVKGQIGEITVSIANKGNSEIKFLNVELLTDKAYDIISNPRIYVGNLESDDFETATFKIHSKSSVPVQLNFKVDYKDTYNNGFSDSSSVTLPLYSIYHAQSIGLVQRSYAWLQILIFIILIVFVYKLYKVWRFERDIEKSIIILFKNTWKWFRNKLRL